MAKRQYNKEFTEPQTWFLIDRHSLNVEPLPNVIKATTNTVIVRIHHVDKVSGRENHSLCTYYRTDAFPTYNQACEVLYDAIQANVNDVRKQVEDAQERLAIARRNFSQTIDRMKRSKNTPNPDAIVGSNDWVYLITENAKKVANTIPALEGDHFANNHSFRTNKPENTQYYASELRKLGLTVAW